MCIECNYRNAIDWGKKKKKSSAKKFSEMTIVGVWKISFRTSSGSCRRGGHEGGKEEEGRKKKRKAVQYNKLLVFGTPRHPENVSCILKERDSKVNPRLSLGSSICFLGPGSLEEEKFLLGLFPFLLCPCPS